MQTSQFTLSEALAKPKGCLYYRRKNIMQTSKFTLSEALAKPKGCLRYWSEDMNENNAKFILNLLKDMKQGLKFKKYTSGLRQHQIQSLYSYLSSQN